jgi:hypothetical protein
VHLELRQAHILQQPEARSGGLVARGIRVAGPAGAWGEVWEVRGEAPGVRGEGRECRVENLEFKVQGLGYRV